MSDTTKKRIGFASLDPAKQLKLARKGGANVPAEKRSFSTNNALAKSAGSKGGRRVAPKDRSFSFNRALAAEAGRKGGRNSQAKRRAAEEAAAKANQLQLFDGH